MENLSLSEKIKNWVFSLSLLSPSSLILLFSLFVINVFSINYTDPIVYEDNTLYEINLDEVVVTAPHPYDVPHIVINKKSTQAQRDSLIMALKPAFVYMANKKGYTPEQISTLFMFESGGYNRLWRLGKNPFSLKARILDKDGTMKAKDDCGDIPCTFATYNTVRGAFEAMERLLDRVYPDAKNLSNREFFVYLKQRGYHSDNSQYIRANMAEQHKVKYFMDFVAPPVQVYAFMQSDDQLIFI